MQNRRHTTSYRPPPVLSLALQEELRAALAEAAARNEPWTGGDVAAWMAERLGRPISYHLGWSYLVRLKQSLQVPRPRHALADAAQQDTFKKHPSPAKASRHGVSAGPRGAVGHRRAPHRLEAVAPPRVGTTRTAPGRPRAAPLRLALPGGLCPSGLRTHPFPPGDQRLHRTLRGRVGRVCPRRRGWPAQTDRAGARPGGAETHQCAPAGA